MNYQTISNRMMMMNKLDLVVQFLFSIKFEISFFKRMRFIANIMGFTVNFIV